MLLRLPALALALSFANPCVPTDAATEDKELVASLELVGDLEANTCGSAAVNLPDPWVRELDLLETEAGVPYWKEDGGVLVSGSVTAKGEYRFRARSRSLAVPADASIGYPGCTLVLDDDIRFTLADARADAGTPAQDVSGSQRTTISIENGSDCRPVLNGNGGNFLALPCAFEYALSGESR